MNKDILELRKKLTDLRIRTYGLSYSNPEKPDFKIWHKEFWEIFDNYEFVDDTYFDEFKGITFSPGAYLIPEEYPGESDKKREEAFKADLEESRKLIDKMISDINNYGEIYGEKFAKAKKEIKKDEVISKSKENINYEGYKVLFEFENYLRDFIESKLKEIYGERWVEEGISKIKIGKDKLINKLEYLKDDIYKQSSGLEYNFPLDYFDIKHYCPVIVCILESILKDPKDQKKIKKYKESLESWFSVIYDIRISIAHCIQIDQGDLDRLKEKTGRIKNFLSNYK